MTDVKIDRLANIAAQSLVTPIRDIDIEAATARYDVNFWGMLRVTQVIAPLLTAAKGSTREYLPPQGLTDTVEEA